MDIRIHLEENKVNITVTGFSGYESMLENLGFSYEPETKEYVKENIPYEQYHELFSVLMKMREKDYNIIIHLIDGDQEFLY
ncbi:hypothetical protein [Candidatus Methanodesulfokora washburnensis]|uniref:Uncharacterized protein n=1 Tax=Candidatus Methanodesulfokora washburnensis TaxID=2478471 RepID=A0A429GEY5_9CREN|nr:hypothetical protein [Candidatus Methanodesulfokores washburnensis]RSN72362.1 hypothetical protein D6D85_14095 [Candidatus Methanodesulfokores washburnensis]